MQKGCLFTRFCKGFGIIKNPMLYDIIFQMASNTSFKQKYNIIFLWLTIYFGMETSYMDILEQIIC